MVDSEYKIEYGWCYTDRNPFKGDNILKIFRTDDYVFDEKYNADVKISFDKLALPFPNEDEVYRGSKSDILFADNNGFTIRIGYADNLGKYINPTIYQPIGWDSTDYIQDKNGNFFTVSIYAGTELYKNVYEEASNRDYKGRVKKLSFDIYKSGVCFTDGDDSNTGVVDGVPILIDTDIDFINPYPKTVASINNSLSKNFNKFSNNADLIEQVMEDVYGDRKQFRKYIDAFKYHQVLRKEFWNAFSYKGEKRTSRLETLWKSCAERLQDSRKPKQEYTQEEKQGVVLYNPWVVKTQKIIFR